MATEFGKYLRKLRVDKGETLKKMAEKLGVGSAFLSAVENGKKKIPKDWNEKISNLYQFTEEQRAQLKQAQQLSQNLIEIDLEPLNQLQKDIVIAFARNIERLDAQNLSQITALLNKGTADLNDVEVAPVDSMPEEVKNWPRKGSIWRHLKTGNLYEVVGNGHIEATVEPAVVYHAADGKDSVNWIRPLDEFLDGRFEEV